MPIFDSISTIHTIKYSNKGDWDMLYLHTPISKQLSMIEYLDQYIIDLAELLNYDIAKLIVFNDEKSYAISKIGFIKTGTSYTKKNSFWRYSIDSSSKSLLNVLLKEKQIVFYSKDEMNDGNYSPLIENINSEVYIPLFLDNLKDKPIIACIYLGTFKENNFDNPEQIFNEVFTKILIKINTLYQIQHMKSQETTKFLNLINMVSEMTKEKEPFMVNHPYNVAQWAKAIGEELSLDENSLEKLYISAILHDIGKFYIEKDILNKDSSLTNSEYEIVKKHSNYSYNIVKEIFTFKDELKDIYSIVKHHHERFDGKGYPDGLKGDEIPLESRIICVADSVDAMLSERTYKDSKPLDYIIKELMSHKGTQFDPTVAMAMANILLKTKEEYKNILSDPIIWGTITITTDEKSHIIDGTIAEYNEGYIFKSDKFNFSYDVDKTKVKKISLYINKNKNIFEYDVKADNFINNRLYISNLEIKPLVDSFNILWDLPGLLPVNTLLNFDINIYKIGGTSLAFYILNLKAQQVLENKLLNIEIFFETEDSVTVTGKITRSFQLGNKHHFEFKYINTPDNIKDKIFKQIFKKQIEIKRWIKDS